MIIQPLAPNFRARLVTELGEGKRMVKLEGVKCFMPCDGVWGKWRSGNYTPRQEPSYWGTSLKQHFIRRIGGLMTGTGDEDGERRPSDNETETFIVNDRRWQWMFLERTRLLLTAPTQAGGRCGIGGPPVLLSARRFHVF